MKRVKDLMPFIPAISPRYTEPRHLEPLVDVFRRIARGEEVHVCFSCPPRHKKTETAIAGCIWLMKQNPAIRIGWATYSDMLSSRSGRKALALAPRARVPLDRRSQSQSEWGTGHDDGGWFGTSIGGPSTGLGFDVKIADDIVKDRITAEQPRAREQTYEWFTDTWGSRGEPGCSDIVLGHRWHEDDLIGRLIKDGWESVALPAIDEDGCALEPGRFDVEALAKKRELIGEYAWWSLWMQQPRTRGFTVFQDVHRFDSPPAIRALAIGVDLAYTASKSADYSVALVLGFDGERFYVLEVVRQQVAAPIFRATLEGLRDRYPGVPMTSYIGGQEKAILELFAEGGLRIEGKPAVGDKFVRAQSASAAWNASRILLPSSVDALRPAGAPSREEDRARQPAWLAPFVDEVVSFTGVKDRRDDQIDALAAAFDAAAAGIRRAPNGLGLAALGRRSIIGGYRDFGGGGRFGSGRGYG